VATRIHRTVVDDIDASTDGVGTYRFVLEGVEYEIDLSEANLQRLRDALAPFTTAGRRLPKHKPATRRTSPTGPATATKRVRRWWADNAERDDLPHRLNQRGPSVHVAQARAARTPSGHRVPALRAADLSNPLGEASMECPPHPNHTLGAVAAPGRKGNHRDDRHETRPEAQRA